MLACLLALQITIKADFPGGSVRVESIEGNVIRVLPALHPDRGWTCWWYFKVEGATPGAALTVDVGGGVWATPDRAVISADDQTWAHTAPGKREKDRIAYAIEAPAAAFWLAWGPPFTLRHARELLGDRAFELCKSRDGHSVPALRIKEGEPKHAIWVHAGQHAWESGARWVGRGFCEFVLSDDRRAAALRKAAEIVFVPIMDVDNVERGAGGKECKPQDHNRDWSDDPYWPEVRAAQAQIRAMGARFKVFVDLHNPGPGKGDQAPYFYTAPAEILSDAARKNVELFLEASRAEITGPLALTGKPRESGASYDKDWERISKNWVSKTAGDGVVAVTLETTWNSPHSTTENYLRVGRELGCAIERFLR
ncbi:MAG TPA: M14 family zinc carboxypeptidase [Planctomycetota bacterium]|nr:M14 family zinc carboxypeptidase [Planctomycetota bacterium]